MTSDDVQILLACLGFGFGSIFWLIFFYILFGTRK